MPTSGDEPCSAASPSSESRGDDMLPLTPAPTRTRSRTGVDGDLLEPRTSSRIVSSSEPSGVGVVAGGLRRDAQPTGAGVVDGSDHVARVAREHDGGRT